MYLGFVINMGTLIRVVHEVMLITPLFIGTCTEKVVHLGL